MMALPQVIQGSWKEIAAHAAQLGDRDDLLLIVPARTHDQNGAEAPTRLADAMKEYVGTSNYGDANLSEDTSRKSAEMLVRKRQ